ncbi:hypothetical protein MMB19_09875 [Ralstonia insidiosa]|jgi:hypothetical protein|nr:hypothetical protein MMB19_09875 [Ralstonia insidiosa]
MERAGSAQPNNLACCPAEGGRHRIAVEVDTNKGGIAQQDQGSGGLVCVRDACRLAHGTEPLAEPCTMPVDDLANLAIRVFGCGIDERTTTPVITASVICRQKLMPTRREERWAI